MEDEKKMEVRRAILQSSPALLHNESFPDDFCLDGAMQYGIYESILLRSSIRDLLA